MVYADAKDESDTDSFSLDWTNVLGSETISTITTTVTSGGVTLGSPSISSATTSVMVSGGTAGTPAVILFRITTSGSRQLDESMTIPIESL